MTRSKSSRIILIAVSALAATAVLLATATALAIGFLPGLHRSAAADRRASPSKGVHRRPPSVRLDLSMETAKLLDVDLLRYDTSAAKSRELVELTRRFVALSARRRPARGVAALMSFGF